MSAVTKLWGKLTARNTQEIFRRTRNARRIERRVYRHTQGEDEECSDKVMGKINKYGGVMVSTGV
jgi:hypothetical protein